MKEISPPPSTSTSSSKLITLFCRRIAASSELWLVTNKEHPPVTTPDASQCCDTVLLFRMTELRMDNASPRSVCATNRRSVEECTNKKEYIMKGEFFLSIAKDAKTILPLK